MGEPTGVPANAALTAPGVPHDYVITPNGYFHPACVQRVESDETVTAAGDVQRMDGTVRRVAACAYPHYAADGTRLDPGVAARFPVGGATASNPPVINGWVAAASYLMPSANSAWFIDAHMSVPAAPRVSSGQTVYFFPGLEDYENVTTIVQPVLAWNGFNDNTWTIASWNCCLSGHTWHSPAVAVSPGETLDGSVAGSNCTADGVCAHWAINTHDIATGGDTTLNTDGYGQAFDWVFGAVLEAYGIAQCGNYPVTGGESFSDIVVKYLPQSQIGHASALQAWQPWLLGGDVDCNYSVVAYPASNSPSIVIKY